MHEQIRLLESCVFQSRTEEDNDRTASTARYIDRRLFDHRIALALSRLKDSRVNMVNQRNSVEKNLIHFTNLSASLQIKLDEQAVRLKFLNFSEECQLCDDDYIFGLYCSTET